MDVRKLSELRAFVFSAMDVRKLGELRAFVRLCQLSPAVLHTEELAFFREWLQSMGGTIPPAPATTSTEETSKGKPEEQPKEPVKSPEPESEESDTDSEGIFEGVYEQDNDDPLERGVEDMEGLQVDFLGLCLEVWPGMAGQPGLNEILSDPEVLAATQDPEVMVAFQDVAQNRANMSKYQNNPKVMNLIGKLSDKFGSKP